MTRQVSNPPMPNKNPLLRPNNADEAKPNKEHEKQMMANNKNIFRGL